MRMFAISPSLFGLALLCSVCPTQLEEPAVETNADAADAAVADETAATDATATTADVAAADEATVAASAIKKDIAINNRKQELADQAAKLVATKAELNRQKLKIINEQLMINLNETSLMQEAYEMATNLGDSDDATRHPEVESALEIMKGQLDVLEKEREKLNEELQMNLLQKKQLEQVLMVDQVVSKVLDKQEEDLKGMISEK
ncbi:hypothetical protein HELRODRAFT_180483 [Helobdella robusta]|uniref:Uncharacterized protein n=1 Tax=Helobdella robusta TaxID=6412 RepID=T1FFZ3_HELRO|nr:hypothetical protein HELRODRAFT_180483 [Helobdella robusta]ESN93833.1 hypothetical protein HELRODRAFT_180483 [Helobdella robusta]